ncbi:ABC transporter substrate-binding protein [Candidatus Clostridium radicumherbarum]|uniref:ABC transporter substrate-binding protein n=1 Tax=Candidatus Clostridium radicumherbarum TaxID=3381662 RepID=A0ABW8TWL7_9CLOT
MKKNLSKYVPYLIVVVLLLTVSIFLKIKITNDEKIKAVIPDEMKNKQIVTIWIRDGADSKTREYQVDKFNKANKDIYIDLKVYNTNDYFNYLRMALASDKKVDIFQYGYYELLKNSNLLNIDDLGLDKSLINRDNLLNFEGKPYGVKVLGNDVKLIWNKDIFKEAGLDPNKPPKTWDDLIKYSQLIKEKCPGIVPFEFPASTWGELKSSIGEIAANQGPIYTTFWNYKDGKYDFSYAKDILSKFNYIYNNGLTINSLDKNSTEDVRKDFYEKKTAMTISTYEDKTYYTNIVPLNFSTGVDNLPKLKLSDTENYFYTENYSALVVNKNITNKEAVKKVYEWLLSEDVNNELYKTGIVLPSNFNNKGTSGGLYGEYNNASNFSHETLDPTNYTNYNPEMTRKLLVDAIEGKEKIDDVINTLNSNYAGYVNFIEKADGLDFNKYKINK